ncbi:hypothetical protein TRVL_03401 [Trypanosoma vivax]|nr:hypothetical protein TRVL_03401 [Trypanosoma vivax]
MRSSSGPDTDAVAAREQSRTKMPRKHIGPTTARMSAQGQQSEMPPHDHICSAPRVALLLVLSSTDGLQTKQDLYLIKSLLFRPICCCSSRGRSSSPRLAVFCFFPRLYSPSSHPLSQRVVSPGSFSLDPRAQSFEFLTKSLWLLFLLFRLKSFLSGHICASSCTPLPFDPLPPPPERPRLLSVRSRDLFSRCPRAPARRKSVSNFLSLSAAAFPLGIGTLFRGANVSSSRPLVPPQVPALALPLLSVLSAQTRNFSSCLLFSCLVGLFDVFLRFPPLSPRLRQSPIHCSLAQRERHFPRRSRPSTCMPSPKVGFTIRSTPRAFLSALFPTVALP